MLKEGDPAPDIRVRADTGEEFRLASLKGKRVVLYFYPRADTPGCTTEACEFRDAIRAFAKKGAAIVGVSPDKPAQQTKFKRERNLLYAHRPYRQLGPAFDFELAEDPIEILLHRAFGQVKLVSNFLVGLSLPH